MKIYLIKCYTPVFFDDYTAHVIAANSKKEARELAKKMAIDKTEKAWDTAKIKIIGKYIGKEKTPFVIFSSYVVED